MKTKIVYAVVSDEKDVYLEEVFLSTYSLRLHNPDAFVELVVDSKTDATIKGDRERMLKYIDKKTVVNVPEHYNKVQTSRYLKTSLRQTVEGDFLFIDSDTIITDSLADADSLTGNVMMVLDYHVSLQQRDCLAEQQSLQAIHIPPSHLFILQHHRPLHPQDKRQQITSTACSFVSTILPLTATRCFSLSNSLIFSEQLVVFLSATRRFSLSNSSFFSEQQITEKLYEERLVWLYAFLGISIIGTD